MIIVYVKLNLSVLSQKKSEWRDICSILYIFPHNMAASNLYRDDVAPCSR